MLCQSLHDPDALEHDTAGIETGLSFIDDIVIYQSPKILQRGYYQLFSYTAIKGYEIHCGRMDKYPLFYQSGRFTGTHVQGVFDDDAFRGDYFKAINPHYQGFHYAHYREAQIQSFTDMVAENLDTAAILQALQAD
jgi:adenosylcobyric acid synthase